MRSPACSQPPLRCRRCPVRASWRTRSWPRSADAIPAPARLMAVADRVVRDALIDPVQEDQLLSKRSQGGMERVTAQVHVGWGAPHILPSAVGAKPKHDPLGRRPGLRSASMGQHGIEHGGLAVVESQQIAR